MSVRHLTLKDMHMLMRFYDRNYHDGHISRSREFITWQYASSPYLIEVEQDLSIIGAVDGDELIGIIEYVPQLLALEPERLEPAVDFRLLLVEKSSSAKNMGMDLVRFFMEEFNIVFGIGARTRMVLDYYTYLGFSSKKMLRYTRILNERMLPYVGVTDLQFEMEIKAMASSTNPGVRVDTRDSIDTNLASLSRDEEVVHLHKDDAYLRWRYMDHPFNTYEFHHVFLDDDLKAVVVTRILEEEKARFSVGAILDIRGSVETAITNSFPGVISYFAHRNVSMVDFFIQYSRYDISLKSMGFVSEIPLDDFADHPIPMYLQPMCYGNVPVTVFYAKDGYAFNPADTEFFIETHHYDKPRYAT